MVSAYNIGTTFACNGVQRLVEDEGVFKSRVQSRLAAPFTAIPLLYDAVVNVVAGVAKAAWAVVTKIAELAIAFFGKDRDFGNFACEAAHHLGKALLGIVAAPLTFVGGVFAPSAVVAGCRALGLAAKPVEGAVQVEEEDIEAQQSTSGSVHSKIASQVLSQAASHVSLQVGGEAGASLRLSQIASVHSEQKQSSVAKSVVTGESAAKPASQHSATGSTAASVSDDKQSETPEEVILADASPVKTGGTVVLYRPLPRPTAVDTDKKVKELSLFEQAKTKGSDLWNSESTAARYGFRAGAIGAPAAAVGTIGYYVLSALGVV